MFVHPPHHWASSCHGGSRHSRTAYTRSTVPDDGSASTTWSVCRSRVGHSCSRRLGEFRPGRLRRCRVRRLRTVRRAPRMLAPAPHCNGSPSTTPSSRAQQPASPRRSAVPSHARPHRAPHASGHASRPSPRASFIPAPSPPPPGPFLLLAAPLVLTSSAQLPSIRTALAFDLPPPVLHTSVFLSTPTPLLPLVHCTCTYLRLPPAQSPSIPAPTCLFRFLTTRPQCEAEGGWSGTGTDPSHPPLWP